MPSRCLSATAELRTSGSVFERVTQGGRQALVAAQAEAKGRGDLMMEGHHLLIGVLDSLEPVLALDTTPGRISKAIATHLDTPIPTPRTRGRISWRRVNERRGAYRRSRR